MHADHFDTQPHKPGGLPRWTLFAALPLALALGFIAGIALAIYLPSAGAAPPASQTGTPALQPVPKGSQTGGANPATATNRGGQPVQPSPAGQPGNRPAGGSALPQAVDQAVPDIRRVPGPSTPGGTALAPGAPVATGPVRTIMEARAALAAEFPEFRVDGRRAFMVDYQLARDVNLNTLLIGIVKIAEYSEWVQVVREQPAQLEAWLQAAAHRVKPAAEKERFALTWTIFEVVNDVPFGFASREVTANRGGGYLVTRPLAAVTDIDRTTVRMATLAELGPAQPATASSPWTAYGPVLRFDPNDLYRPTNSSSRSRP